MPIILIVKATIKILIINKKIAASHAEYINRQNDFSKENFY